MSSALRHFLWSTWQWHRTRIILSACFSILAPLLHFFAPKMSGGADKIIFCAVLLLNLFFLSSKDGFSWKYLQSLPLSKRELYHFSILENFIIFLPLLILVLMYPDTISLLITWKGGYSWDYALNTICFYTGFVIILSLKIFLNRFESTRVPYANKRFLMVHTTINFLYFSFFIFLVILVVAIVATIIESYLKIKPRAVFIIIANVTIMLSLFYWYVFRRWINEHLSYPNPRILFRRDIPFTLVALTLPILVFEYCSREREWNMYTSDKKLRIFQVIAKKDLKTLRKMVTEGKHIQVVSEKGWTPLMAAAHQGHREMYQLLHDHGADTNGKITDVTDKFHGNFDLLIKDKKGKLALDVMKLENKELAYYLKKRTRVPAGKK